MRLVGLTGSIACGKTTVARELRRAGVHVLDLDRIAHEVQEWHNTQHALVACFGPTIARTDGHINREALGKIVFGSRDKLWELNRIMAPRIVLSLAGHLALCLATSPCGVVVLDAPLLFEAGLSRICFGGTLVVHLPRHVQLARLRARDGIGEHDACARVEAQMPSSEKAKLATICVDNTGTQEDLGAMVHTVVLPWLRRSHCGNAMMLFWLAAGVMLLLVLHTRFA